MKVTILLSVLATAATTTTALSSCILDCQASVASDSGCDSNYNTTLCYCSGDFSTNVKACLYQNDCSSDVRTFYSNVDSYCDGEEEASSTAESSSSTIDDTNGTLGTCVLGCQAEAAISAGCSGTNYNETSCYCDNTAFPTDVKICLYQNCADYVSVYYNYRTSICGGANSTEWQNDIAGTSSVDSAATATASSGALSSSTASDSITTDAPVPSSDHNGLSVGAKAGIAVGTIVGGLAIIGALLFVIFRKRRSAKTDVETIYVKPEMRGTASMTSSETLSKN